MWFKVPEVWQWKFNEVDELRDSPATAGDGTPLNAPLQQARLNKARADAQEMANAVQRGELVEAADVLDRWVAVGQRVRAGVLSLGTKLAPELIGMHTERQMARRIDDEVKLILEELIEPGAN